MFDYDFNTVPSRKKYAYWAGLNISIGSIVTSLTNGIIFLLYGDPLLAIGCGIAAGIVVAILLPLFVYPRNLK